MNAVKRLVYVALPALVGFISVSRAEYQARVTLSNGNSFVVEKLEIQGDRLYSGNDQASSAVSMVESIDFRFSTITPKMCETMFRSGDHKALENLLRRNIDEVEPFCRFPGNLGDYLVWLLRVQYWNENQAGIEKTIDQLHLTGNSALAKAASLYSILMMLDQGKDLDAGTAFAGIENPDGFSIPMAEYIRSRLAMGRNDYRQAMQHIAQVIAFHARDAEWFAPATALEAKVYRETGRLKKAETVANELMMAYPGTQWSRLGEEIKAQVQ